MVDEHRTRGEKHSWRLMLVVIVTLISFLSFGYDAFRVAPHSHFRSFAKGSESLVVSKLLARELDMETGRFGLGYLTYNSPSARPGELDSYQIISQLHSFENNDAYRNGISRATAHFMFSYDADIGSPFDDAEQVLLRSNERRRIVSLDKPMPGILRVNLEGAPLSAAEARYPFDISGINKKGDSIPFLKYREYRSSVGLQGFVCSWLYNAGIITNLRLFQLGSVGLLILVLCLVIREVYLRGGAVLALVCGFVFLFSPMLTYLAKNLFWLPSLWFLPLLLGLLTLRLPSKWYIFIPLAFLSLTVKSLCGYEYLSSIILLPLAFFAIDIAKAESREARRRTAILGAAFAVACLVGFVLALLIQAGLRGSSIADGLGRIWREDVLRRTYGNPANQGVFAPSLSASVFEVLGLYILGWQSMIFPKIGAQLVFPFLIVLNLLLLVYGIVRRRKGILVYSLAFVAFMVVPMSWFILAKAHSYIHTHLNYVLWYFGTIQFLLFYPLRMMKEEKDIIKAARAALLKQAGARREARGAKAER
jgi:hypothetical protein